MTYHQALNLLDLRREGADMPQAVVDKALELTGDKEPELIAEAIEELAC